MRTLANESTADQLLDYLASDGRGGEWTRYAELADWESLYNLLGQSGFVGRLARDLAGRGLAEVRRASSGMQLRLTPAGIARADRDHIMLRLQHIAHAGQDQSLLRVSDNHHRFETA